MGFDKVKDPFVIQQAYTNGHRPLEGIAKNMIRRINRELGGNLDISKFYEHSYYDPIARKISTYIISREEQTFEIKGHNFTL